MFIYVYIYIYIYMHIYIHIHIHIQIQIQIQIHIHTHIHIHIHIHIQMPIRIPMPVHMHRHTDVCVYMCMYMYVYVFEYKLYIRICSLNMGARTTSRATLILLADYGGLQKPQPQRNMESAARKSLAKRAKQLQRTSRKKYPHTHKPPPKKGGNRNEHRSGNQPLNLPMSARSLCLDPPPLSWYCST